MKARTHQCMRRARFLLMTDTAVYSICEKRETSTDVCTEMIPFAKAASTLPFQLCSRLILLGQKRLKVTDSGIFSHVHNLRSSFPLLVSNSCVCVHQISEVQQVKSSVLDPQHSSFVRTVLVSGAVRTRELSPRKTPKA